MKKVLYALLGLFLLVLIVIGGAVAWFSSQWQPAFPDTPVPQIKASTDSSIIAEGKYLVNSIAHCTACHLPKKTVFNADSATASNFIPTGGGEWVMGPLGTIRSPNLTSDPETGIANLSDSDIARILRYGIGPDHKARLFMFAVGPMSDEDITAIISYLRTLEPVKNETLPSEVATFGKVIMQAAAPAFIQPKPEFLVEYVPRGDTSIARGKYIANGPGMCFGCHSPTTMSPKLALTGPAFSGGSDVHVDSDDPEMEMVGPNLTPSEKYGVLSSMTEEQFIARIKKGRVVPGSPMPWENYRLMTDADLLSVFRYLKSLEPVENNPGPSYRKKGWKPEGT